MPTTYKCGAVNKDEPIGYIDWHAWAERKKKTHKQQQCPDCGLWHVWVPLPAPPQAKED